MKNPAPTFESIFRSRDSRKKAQKPRKSQLKSRMVPPNSSPNWRMATIFLPDLFVLFCGYELIFLGSSIAIAISISIWIIFIAIEIAIEIGIDSIFQSICSRHLRRISSIAIPIPIAIWIKIKIKNNPQPTTYNPLLGGITEVTSPPFGAGYAGLC